MGSSDFCDIKCIVCRRFFVMLNSEKSRKTSRTGIKFSVNLMTKLVGRGRLGIEDACNTSTPPLVVLIKTIIETKVLAMLKAY